MVLAAGEERFRIGFPPARSNATSADARRLRGPPGGTADTRCGAAGQGCEALLAPKFGPVGCDSGERNEFEGVLSFGAVAGEEGVVGTGVAAGAG